MSCLVCASSWGKSGLSAAKSFTSKSLTLSVCCLVLSGSCTIGFQSFLVKTAACCRWKSWWYQTKPKPSCNTIYKAPQRWGGAAHGNSLWVPQYKQPLSRGEAWLSGDVNNGRGWQLKHLNIMQIKAKFTWRLGIDLANKWQQKVMQQWDGMQRRWSLLESLLYVPYFQDYTLFGTCLHKAC